MPPFLRRSVKISLLNLALVALLGVILRYKIAFPLPLIDEKYFMHAHSHFAFSGWLSQILMTFLLIYLHRESGESVTGKYKWILRSNLVLAYAMIPSFCIQGYGPASIVFSTLSIFVSYFFSARYWSDLNKIKKATPAHDCFRVALVANVLSSIGPFTLAYMMATKNIHQHLYLASVYFYLHFQYNGWFFFSCLGLFFTWLARHQFQSSSANTVFKLFAWSLVPAFLLSILWVDIPWWGYLFAVAAVMAQLAGWYELVRLVRKIPGTIPLPVMAKRLFLLAGLALTIKLLLQAGSVIPSLSHLAFGFRPIVIGYLHLVLLGVISIFILGYVVAEGYLDMNRYLKTGILVFISGILLNEIVLMAQGTLAIGYVAVEGIDYLLFLVALVLLSGMLILNYGVWFSGKSGRNGIKKNGLVTKPNRVE